MATRELGTRERIERIFRDALGVELPAADTDIIAAGILDSLALVTLLFEIEQQFAVTIPLEELDIEALRTVERLTALVASLASLDEEPPRIQGGFGV